MVRDITERQHAYQTLVTVDHWKPAHLPVFHDMDGVFDRLIGPAVDDTPVGTAEPVVAPLAHPRLTVVKSAGLLAADLLKARQIEDFD